MDQCVLCQEDGGGLIKQLGQKGIHSMVAASKPCGDGLHNGSIFMISNKYIITVGYVNIS